MNVNVVLFTLGCAIVTGSLLFNIYSNKNKDDNNYLSSINKFNNINIDKKISSDIESLKTEVQVIKNDFTMVLEILNTNVMSVTDDKSQESNSANLSNILNYSKFMSNNKDIIERYKNNRTIDEIAKELNKSKREVEMVIKLIK